MSGELLKFKVRPGLMVHVETIDERDQKKIESYGASFQSSEVELTPEQVKLHAHALEPICAASVELLERFRFKREQMTPPVDYEAIRHKQWEELLDRLVEKITAKIKTSAVQSKAT